MKKSIQILSAVVFGAVVAFAAVSCKNNAQTTESENASEQTECSACQGAIVYVDLDRILQEYDMANDLSSVVETKVQNIQAEVNRRGKKLENAVKDFQEKMEKGLMTRSVAEAQSQKLQKQEQDFNAYAAQKQQEIQEEQMVMMNQIGDAIKTYIDKYNQEKKFAMILTSQGGTPVITADSTLNVTNEVLAGLNDEYIKTKNQKNED